MAAAVSCWEEKTDERIRRMIAEVERNFGIDITIKDQLGLLRGEDGSPIFRDNFGHNHTYCNAGRTGRSGWVRACRTHCNESVVKRAEEEKRPFVSICYKGTAELVVPVIGKAGLVALIYAGPFRDADYQKAPGGPEFPESVMKMYYKLPVLDNENASGLGLILHSIGQGIMTEVERINAARKTDDRGSVIQAFIYHHSHLPVTLKDLSKELHLSVSRTSHLVTEIAGTSFQELLLQERVRRARTLLLSTILSVRDIAMQTGFSNEFYFSRQFSRVSGISPGRFRKMNRQNELAVC